MRFRSLSVRCILFVLCGMAFFVFASNGFCQSFDCQKAKTGVEKMICNDGEISSLDETLASVYRNAKISGSDKKKLKDEQVRWIKQRNKCKDNACLKTLYKKRISSLEHHISHHIKGSQTNFTGTYKMTSGEGEFRVLHLPNGKATFYVYATWLNSVTGVPNMGELMDSVKLNGNTATYTDKDGDCKMKMTFGNEKVSVTQAGGCGFGMNVSAEGDYVRKSKDAPVFSDLFR